MDLSGVAKLRYMSRESLLQGMTTSSTSNTSDIIFSYCGEHTFIPVWKDNGFSQCFFNTVVTALCVVMIGMLAYQINRIKKWGVSVEVKYRPKSFWYKIQVLCMSLLILEVPIRFGVAWGVAVGHTSGEEIVLLVIRLVLVACCFALLLLERKMMLLTFRMKGHSNILLLAWTLLCAFEIVSIMSWNSTDWWFLKQTSSDEILFGFWIVRLICTSLLFVNGILSPGVPNANDWLRANEDERDVENGLDESTETQSDGNQPGNQSTWSGLKDKLILLFPYMWPSNNILLQLRVVLCIGCLVAGRVVNPYVPIYYKDIVNSLTGGKGWDVVWVQVVAYVGLKCLQGSGFSGGILNGLRSFMWIRVQQYTNRLVQVKLFGHLHSLSLRWHLSRKTGEVLRSIDRGTVSINNLLSYVIFSIVPTICDIIIAIVYFVAAFNAWFGLIVFCCLLLYLVKTKPSNLICNIGFCNYDSQKVNNGCHMCNTRNVRDAATIYITEWRTKFRREMNTKDNRAKQRAIDSLLNFETVKYYNAEDYEVKRFDEAILDYQKSEYMTNSSLVLLNLIQNLVINGGLLVGSLLCASYVIDKEFDIGQFVLFGTYIVQLYTPLGFFGTYYRMIQSSFIDMENMFDLFKEGQDITDNDEAIELSLEAGHVEFENVCFHYAPERKILKNISFSVGPGQTYALVGPSGSGKSTIIRLLFRFYDIQSGVIKLDGVDISTVTQESLRRCIGVVPQDTVLFNDNIMNNIRYGKISASDEEVKGAATSADIHHRIVEMPDQYDTVVGERGLKLSGGEKQRVAIARTMLKAPNVVLLDEATSALDTTTERNIQTSLGRVCAGRTSIVVAHRLSTIVNADCILVVQDGEIVERGSHDDLLSMGGVYKDMWDQQMEEEIGLEVEEKKFASGESSATQKKSD